MSIASVVTAGRAIIASTLLDRCVVLDKTDVSDGEGGTTTTFLPRATDVPCRFAQLTETDVRVIAGQAFGPATATVQVPVGLEVPEGSFIQNVAQDNAFWLVVGDRTPPSATAVVRRLLCREASWVA